MGASHRDLNARSRDSARCSAVADSPVSYRDAATPVPTSSCTTVTRDDNQHLVMVTDTPVTYHDGTRKSHPDSAPPCPADGRHVTKNGTSQGHFAAVDYFCHLPQRKCNPLRSPFLTGSLGWVRYSPHPETQRTRPPKTASRKGPPGQPRDSRGQDRPRDLRPPDKEIPLEPRTRRHRARRSPVRGRAQPLPDNPERRTYPVQGPGRQHKVLSSVTSEGEQGPLETPRCMCHWEKGGIRGSLEGG